MTHIKECPRCLFTSEFATIGEIQCNYCDLHDKLESQSRFNDLNGHVYLIKKQGRRKKYDCLIGISGGLDSSTLLYWAYCHELRPLVIHFDNGYNHPAAESNMKNLVERLNLNSITYKLNKQEYKRLNEAFLWAGTPDADIPNDIAMTKLMYQAADHYGIKWILNGHDFRTEGSTPAAWTYMDARYIHDVYHQFTGRYLKDYPLFTFWDQIRYALKGIKQIRPFHYGFDRKHYEDRMKKTIGWQEYGAKHCENLYTEFVGYCLLPEKFGIDKRIVYLSAQIRSGDLARKEGAMILQAKTLFDINRMGTLKTLCKNTVGNGIIRPRTDFDRYNFKKWKWAIWMLSKLKVVPYTFYVKYTK